MITSCRSCNSTDLKSVLDLGTQYLSDFTMEGDPKPPSFPLNLVLCKSCSLVQLGDTTPQSELYTPRYGYKSGVNDTIRADLKDIVKEVLSRVREEILDESVSKIWLDIASNDGTLLSYVPKNKEWIKVACDPLIKDKFEKENKAIATYCISDFFSLEVWNKRVGSRADVITSISCFYDMPDPNKFVSDVASILKDDGIWVIQQNYLLGMIKQLAYDNICHEHLEFYSLKSLEKLLNRHGLEVFDVTTNDINGGSFRCFVRHMNRVEKMRLMEKRAKLDSPWTYYLFAMKVKDNRKKLYEFIKKEVDAGKKFYVYGCSTRGGTVLQYCGLDKTLIAAGVERNPEKVGKVIASTGIPIISEDQARAERPDYFLCLPWFFADEFKKREQGFVESGGKLLFPLPEPYVYSKEGITNL